MKKESVKALFFLCNTYYREYKNYFYREGSMEQKKLSTYGALCTKYYDCNVPDIHGAEWQLYLSYAKESQGAILEPMCGSGRLLIPLSKAGFVIEGFDASDEMLDALKAKAASQCPVQVWKGFIEDLAVYEKYTLIMIPMSSLNLISDSKTVKKSLSALYASLKPGGLFVFELMMSSLFQTVETQVPIISEFSLPNNTMIRVTKVHQPPVDGLVTTQSDYLLISGENVLQAETEIYTLRFYTPDEMENLLKNVGFKKVQKIKAFDRNSNAQSKDPVMIFEALK